MKADALKAFLQVHLTKENSKLLVINTHKGRYRFKKMPFGTKMSQDVFQMKMDLIMERYPGVISIHDNIVVYGTSEEDHDANLINLLNVAQVEDLVLNSKKLELRECTPLQRNQKKEIKLDMRVDYIAFSKVWIAELKDTMRQDPFLAECTSLLSRDGHIKEGILCEWPGHTGTSETSSLQTKGTAVDGAQNCTFVLSL